MDPSSSSSFGTATLSPSNLPASDARGEVRKQDPRAEYALSLQKACDVAVSRVQNGIVANRNWEAALVTAPSAIGVMAILLKTAGLDAAAGLEVESQDVKDEKGAVQGTLPDVGRLAFLNAEMSMGTIMVAAQNMLTELGPVAAIIGLLECPEDARYNLMPRIAEIKKVAEKCHLNAEEVKSKFEYWHFVIIHLKQTSLTKRGQVIKQQEDTRAEQSKAKAAEYEYNERIKASQDRIKVLEDMVKDAQAEVRRAEEEVDRLKVLPIVPEPAVLEELARIQALFPDTAPPGQREKGIAGKFMEGLFGQSQSEADREAERIRAHKAEIQRLRDKAIQEATEQRTRQRKEASDRLEQALEAEKFSIEALKSAREALISEFDQLADARASLVKTQVDLSQLVTKGKTLEGIMEILQRSINLLSKLKDNIEQLVGFFKASLLDVEASIEYSVVPFLTDVERGIVKGANPQEVQEITMSERSKQRIISLALQMQGRFAAIADISAGYMKISKNYIRPMINEMETLSISTDSEWEDSKVIFDAKCQAAMDDIMRMARETDTKVQTNIALRIQDLKGLAIEAAGGNSQ
ncbi:hypothetical protein ABW21_db0202902 [Orbilia brochopaga]|nr:hypothetical protein ABW21_db0202902 [Drechslerella brochopaga]